MLAAEVVEQIALVASCGYNVNSTIFTENGFVINVVFLVFFKQKKPFKTTDMAPPFGRNSSVSCSPRSATSVSELSLFLSIFTAQHAVVPSHNY